MPITLPDPVLALSMASLQKLNTADVDQLANLWNVFTKCKESIESGRRLENLSWRLWFREAHLLPPDTSLSDLTDFTPLDTPLMSRRSSMAGSYQPSTRSMTPFVPHQPSSSFTSRALQAASVAMAASTHGNASNQTKALSGDLSDPEESEGWSSDDDDDEVEEIDVVQNQELSSLSNSRGRAQIRPSQIASSSNQIITNRSVTSPKSVTSPLARETILNLQQQNEKEVKSNNASSNVSTTHSGADRRRAISSSSAFGSRARVKQHNMQRRRRPLSFQQAIESLLLDRESEFTGKAVSGSTSSLPRSIDESRLPSTSSRLMEERKDLASSDATIAEQIPQNSAPAEFSQPSTPQKVDQLTVSKKPARRISILEGCDETKESSKPKEQSKEPNQSRFFVGAASYEGSEHSIESESFAQQKATSSESKDKEEVALRSPVQRLKNLHPTSSTGSVEGLRKPSGSKAHHPAAHHGRNTSGTIRTKSALNLQRKTGQSKPRGHVRIASMSKELSEAGKSTSSAGNASEHSKKKRQPVTFTMGSMEGDSDDDYSSVASEKQSAEEVAKIAKDTKVQIEVPGENSDEWASDSSTDSEAERKRSAEHRKRAEKERLENMFKKIPVRSQSAADISLLAPGRNSVEQSEPKSEASYSTSPAPPPIRSLLSTIFHPTNEDDLAARRKSHASTADLRIQGEQSSSKKKVRKTSHEGSEIAQQAGHFAKIGKSNTQSTVIPRPPSIGSHLNNAGLKMSKSAVALPVLSTLGSRSSTSISRKEAQGSSRHAAVFEDDSSGESSVSDRANSNTADTSPRQSNSEAVERLNELARARQNQKKQKKKHNQRGSGNGELEERKMSGDGGSRKRTSHSSLDVQVQPEFDEESMIRQYRRTSEPSETPSTQAIATATGKPQRSKSAVNVPEVGLPQSPRTTRRNMLKDELSESLRQNLLWERQSRNRMLGIGGNRLTSAPVVANESQQEQQQQQDRRRRSNEGNLVGFAPLSQTTSAPLQQSTPSSVQLSQSQSQQGHPSFHRNQSVLGGNALRPLTQRSTVPDPNVNRTSKQANSSSSRVTYTGDFHHTGW